MKPRWIAVKVTPAIIREAVPKDCYRCLIALALRKATRRDWHVWHRDARCEDYNLPGRKIWKFPEPVRLAMRAFDRGEAVKPFTFRLPRRFAV